VVEKRSGEDGKGWRQQRKQFCLLTISWDADRNYKGAERNGLLTVLSAFQWPN